MYNNPPQQNYYPQYYQYQYPRYNPVDYTAMQTPPANMIKGRPVLSIEEAKAAQIDLDGSLHIFTDIGNKKIYTKQLNTDGTASLLVYSLVETDTPANDFSPNNYITREEFEKTIAELRTAAHEKVEQEPKRSILASAPVQIPKTNF